MIDRCEFCGKPASPTTIGSMLCADCVERYDAYLCRHCGQRCHTLKSVPHAEVCSLCELRGRMSTLSTDERGTIGGLVKAGDRFAAIKAVRHALGVGIPEAAWIVDQFEG
jgi:hypothetical protein